MNKFSLLLFSFFLFPFLLSAQVPYDCRTVISDGILMCAQKNGDKIETFTLDSNMVSYWTRLDNKGNIEIQNNLGVFDSDSLLIQGNQLIKKDVTGVIEYQKTIPAAVLDRFANEPFAARFGDNSFFFVGTRYISGGPGPVSLFGLQTDVNLNIVDSVEQLLQGNITRYEVRHAYRLSNGNVVVVLRLDGLSTPNLYTTTQIKVFDRDLNNVSTRHLDNQYPDEVYRGVCGHLWIRGAYKYDLFHSRSFYGTGNVLVDEEEDRIVSAFYEGRAGVQYTGSFLVRNLQTSQPDSISSHYEVLVGSYPIPELEFAIHGQNGTSVVNTPLVPYTHALSLDGESLLLFGESDNQVWVMDPDCATPKPDVIPSFGMTNPSSISNGDDLQIQWTLENIGDTVASNFQFRAYLSADDELSTDDEVITTQYVQNLPIGQASSGMFDWQLSMHNTIAGANYVLFVADSGDALEESDETNNVRAISLDVSLNETVSDCVRPFIQGDFLCSEEVNNEIVAYTKQGIAIWKTTFHDDGSLTQFISGWDLENILVVQNGHLFKSTPTGIGIFNIPIPQNILSLFGGEVKAVELSPTEFLLVGWKRQGQFNPTTTKLIAAKVDLSMTLLASATLRTASHVGPLSGNEDEVVDLLVADNGTADVIYHYGTFNAQLGKQYNSGTIRLDATDLSTLSDHIFSREKINTVTKTPCSSYLLEGEVSGGDAIHSSFGAKSRRMIDNSTHNQRSIWVRGGGGNQADGPFEQLDFLAENELESNLKWRKNYVPLPDLDFEFLGQGITKTSPYLPYIHAYRIGDRVVLFGELNDSLWIFDLECTTPPMACTNTVLENPSFDNGLTGWQGNGELRNNPNYVAVCTNWGSARQTQAAQAGKTYSLEVDAYRDAGVTGVIGLKFLGSSWQVLFEDYRGITTSSFSPVQLTGTAPTGTVWVEVSLVKTNSTQGCIYADKWCLNDGGGDACSPDVTPPSLTCPGDIYLTTTGTTAVPQWSHPDVTDNCPGNAYAIGSHQPGLAYLVGVTTVTYTAQDAAGNTSTCSFTVTIEQQSGGDCANNYLDNPDFENQNISGWSGAGTYAETNGRRYISVCTNGSAAYQTKAAEAGKTYVLKAKASRSFNDSEGVIGLKFMSNTWQVLKDEYQGVFTATFDEITIEEVAPSGTAFVEVSLVKTGGSGCVNADDWCLSQDGISSPVCSGNVVENPSYANGNAAQWAGDFTIGDDPQLGIYWANICGASNYIYQTFPVFDGQSLQLSVKAALSSNVAQGVITAKFMSSTWSVLKQDFINISSTNFETIGGTFIAPPNAAWLEISAYNSGSTGCINVYDWCMTTPNAPFVQGVPPTPIEPNSDVVLFPNPTAGSVFLNLENYADKEVDILLVDNLGKVVWTKMSQAITSTKDQIYLDLSQIQNGQYFVQIRSAGERTMVKKLVVTRMY